MILFEKLFQYELTEQARWLFLEGLGALDEGFVFVEKTSSVVLRVCKIEQRKRSLLLQPEDKTGLPIITLQYTKNIPAQKSRLSFFVEKVLPYPWSEFLGSPDSDEIQMSFSDDSFQKKCEALKLSLAELEKICVKTELTSFLFGDSPENLAYIFHSVRNKLLKLGLCSQELLHSLRPDLQLVRFGSLQCGADNPLNLKGFDLASFRIKHLKSSETGPGQCPTEISQDLPIHFEL